MSTLTRPRNPVKPSRKPVVAELTLHINSTPYVVIAIAPGPDNTRAFRLVKDGDADSVYDVARTDEGLVVCDCPSYVATYEGNGLAMCKHGAALVQVGLVESPFTVAAPAPIADEPDAPESEIISDMPAAPVAEPESEVISDLPPASSPAPESRKIRDLPPARVVPAFDRDFYRAQDAVAEGRALWLSHRHLHTSEPLPSVNQFRDLTKVADVRFVDDDGSILETPAEMDDRHREEQAAKVAALMDGNPFLPAARETEQVPCCDPGEAQPCQACVNVHTLPDDLSGDDWEDGYRWEMTPDADPDGWLPTADELRQAEEDGAYEQCEGEGPMADATDECHAAVAAGLADWMREFGLVPYIDWVSRENRDELHADDAILCGWACHRERPRHEGVKARQLAYATAPDVTVEFDLSGQVADVADAYKANGTAFGKSVSAWDFTVWVAAR